MAGKKAATVIDAARALLSGSPEAIQAWDVETIKRLASSAYLTSPELHYLHDRLAQYSGKLALLGFIYSDLAIPGPGPVSGAVQSEIPGIYKVDQFENVTAGTVDAGSGRRFLTLSWGGACPGTIILRRNENPDCWVEVANYVDRKEPEAAVTCHLLVGKGNQGTPFDSFKKALQTADRRYWRERNTHVKTAMRDASVQRESGGDAGRNP